MKKIIATAIASIFALAACGGPGDRYVGFAQCLTKKQIVMYGAFWCPHCANQKKFFGEKTFNDYVTYVECDPRGKNAQPNVCLEKGVNSYPTWFFPNGERLEGEQQLETLARKSGCELPPEEGDEVAGANDKAAENADDTTEPSGSE